MNERACLRWKHSRACRRIQGAITAARKVLPRGQPYAFLLFSSPSFSPSLGGERSHKALEMFCKALKIYLWRSIVETSVEWVWTKNERSTLFMIGGMYELLSLLMFGGMCEMETMDVII